MIAINDVTNNTTNVVKNVVNIELTNASTDTMLPSTQEFQHWTQAALAAMPVAPSGNAGKSPAAVAELSIRVVDEDESAQLNQQYRQKSGPTNILSFPCADMPGTGISLLGDLAICAPLVRKEAQEQNKTLDAHWAHLTVHGVLHLKGHDHESSAEAEKMEALEVSILDSLGYPNPYYQEVKGDE